MESGIELGTQIALIKWHLYASLLVLVLTIIPIVYNYCIVYVPKLWNTMVWFYGISVGPFMKILIAGCLIWIACVFNNGYFTTFVVSIILGMGIFAFSNMWERIYTDLNLKPIRLYEDKTYYGLYNITNIEQIYKLLDYEECFSCDEEFVRERGWSVRIRFKDWNHKTIHICRRCASSKKEVKDFLNDEQMMAQIYNQLNEEKRPDVPWYGTSTDDFIGNY